MSEYPIANPSDHDTGKNAKLFLMWAGAYGDTRVYVWADHFADAFEHLVEWLDDNAPGLLARLDYEQAAEELGLSTNFDDLSEADQERVREHAETDMTTVGHTTLDNGDCIPSWEWGGCEVGSPDYEAVKARSVAESEAE